MICVVSRCSRRILALSILSVLALHVTSTRVSAQDGQGIFVTQASERLGKLIDKANKGGFSLQNNSFSIGGGWLKKDDKWVGLYTVQLTAGKQYRFLASGDKDAKDVDLRITDLKGE